MALIKFDGRHSSWAHPFFTMVGLFTAIIGSTLFVHDWLVARAPASYHPSSMLEYNAPALNFQSWVAYLFFIYVIIMVLSRYLDCGSYIFYETVWCCNSSLLMAAIGILTQRPLLVGASVAGVCADQLLWYLDCGAYLATGKFKVGVAKYLIWPETSWSKRYLCTHHLWFMPLALWTLGWHLPVHSFLLSCWFTSISTGLCRYFTPKMWKDIYNNHEHYMNVNAGHEFWRDAGRGTFIHKFNDHPAYVYLPFVFFVANLFINGPAYLLLNPLMGLISK